MRFSNQELKDLFIAWLFISVAFGIVFRHLSTLTTAIIVSFLTVGVGFVFHEMAHKYVAQRMGKFAEFHAFLPMLVLAVFTSFFGFVFAAPGAVYISGFVSRKENGIIGVAGPLANIVLCLIFIPFFILSETGSVLHLLASFGFAINAFLALFNMLPFGMFDGAKIISWNKFAYAAVTVVAVLLTFVSAQLGVF